MRTGVGGQDAFDMRLAYEQCMFILEFVSQIEPPSPIYADFISVTKNVYSKQDVKGMMAVKREVFDSVLALKDDDRGKLVAALGDKFGLQVRTEFDVHRKVCDAIRERGEIRSTSEYREVLARVDEVFQDESHHDELEALNRLLVQYDERND